MDRRHLIAAACLSLAVVVTPAVGDVGRRVASHFQRRALVEGEIAPDQAYAIPLSSEGVAALKAGQEMRIFDAAGREISSLIHAAVSHGEVIERPVTIFNRAFTADGTQTLSVELADRKPMPANEFVFDIANHEYNVRALVEASQDGENWQILRDGLHLIRHTVKDEKIDYRHDVLRVPTARFRFYRFTLRPTLPTAGSSEFAEQPLDIGGIAVREVVRRGSALTVRPAIEHYTDDRDLDSRHVYYRLDLGRENLGVDQLSFTVPETDFARSASLWEWSPERERRTRRLAQCIAFHYGDDVSTEFSGFTTDSRFLALMIDQGDNEPITVTTAVASRPRQQVRFIGPSQVTLPVALYFQADVPRTPRYDLERRLREHEITTFTELSAGPIEPNPDYAKPAEPRSETIPFLLYAIVVPLVAGLGWYLFRTIQRGVPPDPSSPA